MRLTRMIPALLVTALALVGGAMAIGGSLHASHAADAAGHAVSGSHSASVDDHGATASSGLNLGDVQVGNRLGINTPALPSLDDPTSVPALATGAMDSATVSTPVGDAQATAGASLGLH